MVIGKILSLEDGIDKVNEIILEVFITEKSFKENVLIDASRNQVFLALVFEGINSNTPIGMGSLLIGNDSASLKWIAVKEAYRRKSYGDMIVRMLVEKAKVMECHDIWVEVPIELIKMFENIGFLPISDIVIKENSSILVSSIRMKYENEHVRKCQKIKEIDELPK